MAAKAKTNSKARVNRNKSLCVTKSISLPLPLIAAVDSKYSDDQEWEWSSHVRKLVRADLEASKAA